MRILDLCLGEYFLAKVATQILWSAEVDFTTEHLGQLQLHACESDKAGDTVRLEFDEHVNVAVRSEIGPKC